MTFTPPPPEEPQGAKDPEAEYGSFDPTQAVASWRDEDQWEAKPADDDARRAVALAGRPRPPPPPLAASDCPSLVAWAQVAQPERGASDRDRPEQVGQRQVARGGRGAAGFEPHALYGLVGRREGAWPIHTLSPPTRAFW